ncbi:periplasmic binding protein-like II [Peniophora sp. CONT]|nr:periplasmic binding protein-like II [Peniophora sp. CONT]
MSFLRIGYVREHFSSPLLQYAADDGEKTFKLVECPGGTGQLIARLENNEIDVAIALTDPLIAGIANGKDFYKLVGSYVTTPLNWAVITGKDAPYQKIEDLKGTTLGISRPGSGSQTMASVMALREKWPSDAISFKVNNDIHGLVASVNDGSTSAFMWEWFTTKPWADRGEVRFIGSVPTPWPSWQIAAHISEERAPRDLLKQFLTKLSDYVRAFDAPEARKEKDVEFIKSTFGYPETDVRAWLDTVAYPKDCDKIPTTDITETVAVLVKAGVVKPLPNGEAHSAEAFIDAKVTSLI